MLLAQSIREEARQSERAMGSGARRGRARAARARRCADAPGVGTRRSSRRRRSRASHGPARCSSTATCGRSARGSSGCSGARAATDSGQRVRGWKLDLDHPWKRGVEGVRRRRRPPPLPAAARARATSTSEVDATLETPAMEFSEDELSSAEVLQIVEATIRPSPARPPRSRPRPKNARARASPSACAGSRAATRSADAIEALAELRRARAAAEGGPPAARCQAALALAMTLAIAGRPEEALLEALDALARAREAQGRQGGGRLHGAAGEALCRRRAGR